MPVAVFGDVTAELRLLVVPEGGELPPEEELVAAEEAEAAEAEQAAAAHAEAESLVESVIAEDEADEAEEAEEAAADEEAVEAEAEADPAEEDESEAEAVATAEDDEPSDPAIGVPHRPVLGPRPAGMRVCRFLSTALWKEAVQASPHVVHGVWISSGTFRSQRDSGARSSTATSAPSANIRSVMPAHSPVHPTFALRFPQRCGTRPATVLLAPDGRVRIDQLAPLAMPFPGWLLSHPRISRPRSTCSGR